MTLSADIRRGAEMTDPLTQLFCLHTNEKVQACAFGAALYGSGAHRLEEDLDDIYTGNCFVMLEKHYPEITLDQIDVPCGCVKFFNGNIGNAIIHLNDTENWTREAIADWLESLGY